MINQEKRRDAEAENDEIFKKVCGGQLHGVKFTNTVITNYTCLSVPLSCKYRGLNAHRAVLHSEA